MTGFAPIEVYCTFGAKGNVVTEIKHYQNNVIEVEKCDQPQCFHKAIEYQVPMEQIEALISVSKTCDQTISFGCLWAPLFVNDVERGGWSDRNGNHSLIRGVLIQSCSSGAQYFTKYVFFHQQF